ncbi:MAG: hypothetical protein MHPSP_003826, partial [Paramarteilia canceri]
MVNPKILIACQNLPLNFLSFRFRLTGCKSYAKPEHMKWRKESKVIHPKLPENLSHKLDFRQLRDIKRRYLVAHYFP